MCQKTRYEWQNALGGVTNIKYLKNTPEWKGLSETKLVLYIVKMKLDWSVNGEDKHLPRLEMKMNSYLVLSGGHGARVVD